MAQEQGINKKAFLEDYYPDETILLFKRRKAINKLREQQLNKDNKKEEVEEVYWDQMGI